MHYHEISSRTYMNCPLKSRSRPIPTVKLQWYEARTHFLHCIQVLFTPSYKPDEQPGTARLLSYHLPWAWPEHLHLLEGCECKLLPQKIYSCTTIAPEHVTNCKLIRNVFTSPVNLCCKKSLTYVNHRIQYPMSSQLQLDSLLPPNLSMTCTPAPSEGCEYK